MAINSATFLVQWKRDPSGARQELAYLTQPQIVTLASALASLCPATSPAGDYGWWLKQFRCPPIPANLAAQGWGWDVGGTALVCSSGAVEIVIHQTGGRAFRKARAFSRHRVSFAKQEGDD